MNWEDRTMRAGLSWRLFRGVTSVALMLAVGPTSAAPPESGTFVTLHEKGDCADVYLHKRIELPPGKIVRAWTAISATHEFVLFVNGQEASRSRYGRVASAFRLAEEIEDLAGFFAPGNNTLAMKVHRWSILPPRGLPVYIDGDVAPRCGTHREVRGPALLQLQVGERGGPHRRATAKLGRQHPEAPRQPAPQI
jgi:hypothetical protein